MYERFIDIYTEVDIDFALAFVHNQARTRGFTNLLSNSFYMMVELYILSMSSKYSQFAGDITLMGKSPSSQLDGKIT